MKRKAKTQKKAQKDDDKKTQELIKKLNAQPLHDITEMNMFNENHEVIQFKNA